MGAKATLRLALPGLVVSMAWLLGTGCQPQSLPTPDSSATEVPGPEAPCRSEGFDPSQAARLARAEGLKRPNLIVLISLDTVRADHMGAYGYPKPTTPALDGFSRESVLFETSIAQASSTLPSHGSILTSRIPSHHGGFVSLGQKISSGIPTLAALLKAEGYKTGAFTGGGQLSKDYGLDRGFDHYEETADNQTFLHAVRDALKWINLNPKQDLFVFLHTYEPHHPYHAEQYLDLFETDYRGRLPDQIEVSLLRDINEGREPLEEGDLDHIVSAYDADLRATDDGFRRLLRALRRQGRIDDALVVVTSDHGEEFGEHGKVGWHSHTLFDELLKVPLVIRFPDAKFSGQRVSPSVRSLDIAPTILAVAGAATPAAFEGRSLLPLVTGLEQAHRPALSELDADSKLVAYRGERFKLIGEDLFELSAEREQEPVDRPDEVARLRKLKNDWLSCASRPPGEPALLQSDTEEELRQLGYIE